MLGELSKIGDKVVLVNLTSPEGNYNPGYPEGTICKIVGYCLIAQGVDENQRSKGLKPGMYENRFWPKIEMPDGKVMKMGEWHLTPVNFLDYLSRHQEFLEYNQKDKDYFWHSMIPHWKEELPETEFHVGNIVKVWDSDGNQREFMGARFFKITRIDYNSLWEQIHEGKDRRQIYHIETYPKTPSSVYLNTDDRLEYVDVA